MGEGAGEPGRYRAFLSYSHKDSAVGARLHRRLESYRIPKHLVGNETARGIVPARLSPIFRDREELVAAESLSESVKAALAVSDTLIVMCSPSARTSPWVAKEIETFRALHPGRPVLAALISGEPDEAFPEALIASEPIAADFRKGRDGERLALLKLIAGMTALPLDALVQRDAQRQLRRVTAITGGALSAVLVMALLLAFALRAQAEAERQRAEAEGLVEYMLTDLRDRLKGVGRLDVMTAVNERAMKYYGVTTPEGQLLKARLLHAMGEDDDARGDLNAARAKFLDAAKLTQSVMARRPIDQAAIFAQAQTEYWLGYVAMRDGAVATMRQRFLNYKRLADRLVQIDPSKIDWTKEAAYAEGNLCTAYLEKPREPTRAVAACTNALGKMKRVSAADPDDVNASLSVANRHGWLGDSYDAAGDINRALAQRAAQRGVASEGLRRSPQDARWQDALMVSMIGSGEQSLRAGRSREAEGFLRGARALALSRLQRDPANNGVRKYLARIDKQLIRKGVRL